MRLYDYLEKKKSLNIYFVLAEIYKITVALHLENGTRIKKLEEYFLLLLLSRNRIRFVRLCQEQKKTCRAIIKFSDNVIQHN